MYLAKPLTEKFCLFGGGQRPTVQTSVMIILGNRVFKNVQNGSLIPDVSSTILKELGGTSKIRCTAVCKQYGDNCQAATYH